MAVSEVTRVHFGHFTGPPELPLLAGQKIVLSGFVIRHPDGIVLLDTGIGEGSPEAEERYHPVRRPLDAVLRTAGIAPRDVDLVVNCHLHFDHSGGNFRFPGIPIFAQRTEYDAAHEPDYTLPEAACDFEGAKFELVEGEAEPLSGIRILPTPGHVPGHQSVLVLTHAGRVLLAGQAFNTATQYAAAHLAWRLEHDGSEDRVPYPEWIARVQEFDPQRVMFAHDLAVWDASDAASAAASV